MTQEATVCGLSGDSAIVEVTRKSACGGDCGTCKGCAHPEQIIRIRTGNSVGADIGDRVIIESSGKRVLVSASVAYILPVLLMIAFYFIPAGSEGTKILLSFTGLALGVLICFIYSRILARSAIRAEIKSILR